MIGFVVLWGLTVAIGITFVVTVANSGKGWRKVHSIINNGLFVLSLIFLATGIVLNEQAQAEYAKYDAVEWYEVLLEDEGDSALEELGGNRELPDIDKIIFEVALKEGFAAKKEALCFIAKVQHCNKRYGIFSKYWLLRKKVTGRDISELI